MAKELLSFAEPPVILNGLQKGRARCEHCEAMLGSYVVLEQSGTTYKVGEDCAIKLLLGFGREEFKKYRPYCMKALRFARKFPSELYSVMMFGELDTILWQHRKFPGEVHKLSYSGMVDSKTIFNTVRAYLIIKSKAV